MKTKFRLTAAILAVVMATLPATNSRACSRAVYLGPEDTIITVRSMDWATDLGSNLWAFPRGMKRDGACGPKSIAVDLEVRERDRDGLRGGDGGWHEREGTRGEPALPG